MSYVSFNNAYGYPIYVQTLQAVQYGTLVFDGSSAVVDNLAFSNINTSNIIALDFAAPTIRDSTFTLGDDGRGYDALRFVPMKQVRDPLCADHHWLDLYWKHPSPVW